MPDGSSRCYISFSLIKDPLLLVKDYSAKRARRREIEAREIEARVRKPLNRPEWPPPGSLVGEMAGTAGRGSERLAGGET